MAILAQIRNRPIFLIIIIGMALFAFVLSGVFGNSNGPVRNSIGTVNGEEISAQNFAAQLQAQNNGNTATLQNVTTVWDRIVKNKIYKDQIEKAGIVVGEKNIWDAIVKQNENSPQFKNEDGIFDENKLKEFVVTLADNKNTPAGKNAWLNWVNNENNIKAFIEQTTYDNLIKAGLTASLKEGERTYFSENTSADIQFVYEPYGTVKEKVTISDNEILTYMNAHVKEFNTEAATAVDFVQFKIEPSTTDIAAAKTKIESFLEDKKVYNKDLKRDENRVGYRNTKDVKTFLIDYSDTPFIDKNYLSSDLPLEVYTNLSNSKIGSIYGPYKDNGYFKVAKLMNNKGLKSAKSSHILLAYLGATRAKPTVTRTREEAQALAKNIKKQVNASNFADKAKEFSDGGSAPKGGDIGWFNEKSGLAQEYKDFIFNNRKGTIKIVETSFGFHIIKIDDTKTEKGLGLGILTIKLDPSTETENKIFQNVEIFAAKLKKGEKLLDAVKENNYKIVSSGNLTNFSENLGVLGKQRSIVKWSFNEDTKVGDSNRFDLNNGGYAVAVLTKKNPKGLMSLSDARPKIETILMNEKKAFIIKNKIKGSTTIEEIASTLGKSVNVSNGLSISNPLLKVGGRDNNIAGAILYMKENDLKIINGNNGVYAIKVIKKTAPFDIKKFDTYANTITTKLKNRSAKIYEALKESSNLEDNKAVFY